MYVVRRITNIWRKKNSAASVAAAVFVGTFAEQVCEEPACEIPVLAVYTVAHLGRVYLALYESGVAQLLEVLRHGGLRYGQHFVYVSEEAALLVRRGTARWLCGRVAQRLGKACQPLLVIGVVSALHGVWWFPVFSLFANIRTMSGSPSPVVHFFSERRPSPWGRADVLAYIWNNGRRHPKRAQSLCASDIRYVVSVYNTLSLQSCVGMGNFTIET